MEKKCRTDECVGTTLEVYCDDCLGDGTDPARNEQIEAMKSVVDTMLTAWELGLSQMARDSLSPANLEELRDGFVGVCMLGMED